MLVFSVGNPDAYSGFEDFTVLRETKMGIYAGPAFKQYRSAPAASIARLPFVLPIAGSSVDDRIMQLLEDAGIMYSAVFARTQYTDVMLAMVKQNKCLAVLMESMVRDAEKCGEVFNLGVELPPVYRGLFQSGGATPQHKAVESFLMRVL